MSNKGYEFRQIDLINHSVKPKGSNLLSFFYPNFKIVKENPMIIDSPTIYIGDVEYLNRVKDFGYPVISVTTLGEFDLTSNRTLVNLTFSKWNKVPSARLVKYIDEIDYEDLLNAVKIHWLTGKWTIRKYNKSGSFLKIAESFSEGAANVLSAYIDLLDDKYNSGAYMEKSLFSFIEKIASQTKGDSYWYNKILKHYSRGKKDLLYQAMEKYIRSNVDNKDLKTYNLLHDLVLLDKNWTS